MPTCIANNNFLLPHPFQKKVDTGSYNRFLTILSEQKNVAQAVFTFPIVCDDPLPYLTLLDPLKEFLFYNEKPDQQKAIAAGGSLTEITASGSGRFLNIHQAVEQVKNETLHFNSTSHDSGFHFLGGFSFFDEIKTDGWENFKSASFTLPKRLIIKDKNLSTLSIGIDLEQDRSVLQIHRQVLSELKSFKTSVPVDRTFTVNGRHHFSAITSAGSYEEWSAAITKAKRKIAEKKLDKIVLARELKVTSKMKYKLSNVLNRLRKQYPNCCTYLVRAGTSEAFIGSSPERLLSFQKGSFQTDALAGSMPRGETEEQDQLLEDKLTNSAKNKEEHYLVKKYIEEKLSSIIQSMEAPERPFVKKLANVQHLYTPVKFEFNLPITPLQVLYKLHPTPALGGYPQKKVVHYLQKHYLINRGWFGAPVGWINTNGSGEFMVAIRSGLVSEYSARLFAGCGIVADSEPGIEWEESQLKFIPMLSALNYE